MADAAHLGGILTGFLFVRWLVQGRGLRIRWASPARGRSIPHPGGHGAAQARGLANSDAGKLDALPAEEFISREVDPILDKISAHGFQSLTERERQILEQARSKISRR